MYCSYIIYPICTFSLCCLLCPILNTSYKNIVRNHFKVHRHRVALKYLNADVVENIRLNFDPYCFTLTPIYILFRNFIQQNILYDNCETNMIENQSSVQCFQRRPRWVRKL